MRGNDQGLIWTVMGALGAMALGIVLIPLRGVVAASNLAFVFLGFTIVVAELGGRSPALVTALLSALSLNFFLTQPYLTLSIYHTDDVIAFFALAACGLIAAAFGRRREQPASPTKWGSTASASRRKGRHADSSLTLLVRGGRARRRLRGKCGGGIAREARDRDTTGAAVRRCRLRRARPC
jgi:hypothetical protein